MKIAVLVRYVPEPTATWPLGSDHTLDRSAVEGRISELDEYPVEQAVRLRETGAAVLPALTALVRERRSQPTVVARLVLGLLMAVASPGNPARRLLRWTAPGAATVPPPH